MPPDSSKKTIENMDRELIRQADEHHAIERYIAAAKCLKGVSDDSLLTPLHRRIIEIAEHAAEIKHNLFQDHPENEGWKKQSESTATAMLLFTTRWTAEAIELSVVLIHRLKAACSIPFFLFSTKASCITHGCHATQSQ